MTASAARPQLVPPPRSTASGLRISAIATANGLQQTMQTDDARRFLLSDAARFPSDHVDYVNLSSAQFLVGRYDDALWNARIAVSLRRSASALLNLAIILETMGCFVESHAAAKEAYMLQPSDELTGGLYADSLIRRGEWREGWPLHLRYHHGMQALRQWIPEWPGPAASLVAKRLLVVEGGGFGDNLLFLRWLPRLAALGAIVTYVAPAALVPLVTANADRLGVSAVLPNLRGNAAIRPADYDYFTPLLALPSHFNVTLADLAWTGPYLTVPAAKASVRDVYGDSLTPSVGIAWRAGEGAYPVRYRTLCDSQLRRLLAVRGVRWVSLQPDARPPAGCPCDEPAIADWLDTAAILSNLDLLVTVDTGIAHLTGALGVPAWVMLPGRSSWPFLLARADSPLYPSVRVFRNRGVGIDNAVTAAVAALVNDNLRRPEARA